MTECYSVIKRNQLLINTKTWVIPKSNANFKMLTSTGYLPYYSVFIWHSGKGKTVEIQIRSVASRGEKGQRTSYPRLQGICGTMGAPCFLKLPPRSFLITWACQMHTATHLNRLAFTQTKSPTINLCGEEGKRLDNQVQRVTSIGSGAKPRSTWRTLKKEKKKKPAVMTLLGQLKGKNQWTV